jgi:phosphoribosyl 1,2-cyclic phosphate phosphodiesterase
LEYLIVDCLRKDKHPSHFNYNDALNLIKIIKPKKSILTNLHVDLDYFKLKKKLPKNIIPAYDSLSFNF